MVKKIVFFAVIIFAFYGCSFLLSSPFSQMASWADHSIKLDNKIGDIASPPYEGVDIRVRCVGNAYEPDTVYVLLVAFAGGPDAKFKLIVMDENLAIQAEFTESNFPDLQGLSPYNIFLDGSYLWWGTYRIDVNGNSVENVGASYDAQYVFKNGADYYLLKNQTQSNVLSYTAVSSFPPTAAPAYTNIQYFSTSPPTIDNWTYAWETESFFSILMESSNNEFVILSLPYGAPAAPLFDNYPHAHFPRDAGYDLWGGDRVSVGGDSIIVIKKEYDSTYMERYVLDGDKKGTDEWPFDDNYPFTLSRDGSSLYIFDRMAGYLYRGAVWW